MTNSRLFSFVGSSGGVWKIVSTNVLIGEGLPSADFLSVVSGNVTEPLKGWVLKGVTSNERYVNQVEKKELVSRQEGLGREGATCAVLIPIRKSATWWGMTQEERREVFEEKSHHIKIGMKALPSIARRLHHCRDLEEASPFDFLTWFEFSPEHTEIFDEMLHELRSTLEWNYVDREVEIRMSSISTGMGRVF